MFTVNKNPSVRDLSKFGWAMLFGFGVIGAVLWLAPWIKHRDAALLDWSGTSVQITAVCVWTVGLLLCLLGTIAPAVAKPVYVIWMTVGVAIGTVMSTVLLTVMFFVLLPVFSLVVRLGDPLRKKRHNGKTYWEDYKPHDVTIERLQRPF